jgi:hypothetical protein
MVDDAQRASQDRFVIPIGNAIIRLDLILAHATLNKGKRLHWERPPRYGQIDRRE